MKILIAKNDAGRFTKIGTCRMTKSDRADGKPGFASRSAAIKPGSIAYLWARKAAKYFKAEPAAIDIDFEFGSIKMRISRVD